MSKNILFCFCVLVFFTACKEEVDNSVPKVNKFIKNVFEDAYLWKDEIGTVNASSETDPFRLFDKYLYIDDRWSRLTNDVQGLNSNFSGTGTTFGYSLSFYRARNSDEVYSVIEYVYNDSPAMQAGLKRGDILLRMNNDKITLSNYTDLVYASSLTLTLGKYENGVISLTDVTVSMQAVNNYMNPIVTNKVIDTDGHKIGYLLYTGYLLRSHADLKDVFTGFKTAGVTDLILDLRYNSGGYSITAQYLCASLVPANVLDEKDIYLQQKWNDDYIDYYTQNGISTKMYYDKEIAYTGDDGKYVKDKVENLNLNRIYILTGTKTASASEATIIGLMPYLDVTLIGDTTSGKYCGGIVVEPKHYKMYDSDIANWGMYTMVYRFTNKKGYPESTRGLIPEFYVKENILLSPLEPGDKDEVLTAKAISLITGQAPKNVQKSPAYIQYRKADELNVVPDAGFIDMGAALK